MTCDCAFCTGAKKWEDNWCPCCGNVKLEPPRWWENLDVCDSCHTLLFAEGSKPLTVEQRADFALGNLRLSGSEATEEMVIAAATKTAKPH